MANGFEIKLDVTNEKDIAKIANDLNKYAVYVGIPQKSSSRNGEITNAELLFIQTNGVKKATTITDNAPKGNAAYLMYEHEHGSPLYRIPPRPVLEPALNDKKDDIRHTLDKSVKIGLDGDMPGYVNALQRLGLRCQNFVRAWFNNPKNGWAPNAPATIRAKGSDKPLIDTGELRKSITYVVRKGGRDID